MKPEGRLDFRIGTTHPHLKERVMDHEQLFKMLCDHDWSYNFSDDRRVWKEGDESLNALGYALVTATEEEAMMAVLSFWGQYIEKQYTQIQKTFDNSFGYYEWLRRYLPKDHKDYKAK